jgi:hypothetical protein
VDVNLIDTMIANLRKELADVESIIASFEELAVANGGEAKRKNRRSKKASAAGPVDDTAELGRSEMRQAK